MPRSDEAKTLLADARQIAIKMYNITITDAWYPDGGGNIEAASMESQRHSMAAVLSGVRQAGGTNALTGRANIRQAEPDDWLRQGRRTVAFQKGICTDCAAAAAVKFLAYLDEADIAATVEIVSTGTHAFVIVNRSGDDINDPASWGDECFGIDIWMQNQFAYGVVRGAFWIDSSHNVARFIHDSARRLRQEVVLR